MFAYVGSMDLLKELNKN